MTPFPFAGEIFSLAAAIIWSLAVILFRKAGENVGPIALNLFKNVLSLILFCVSVLVVGQSLFRDVPFSHYALLLLSGAIGIGVSDVLFFMTLNRLGAGLLAIVDTSYSPFIILLSFVFLGERLNSNQLIGVALIVGAVLGVSGMTGPTRERSGRQLAIGITLGISQTLTQAISIVMIKQLLEDSPLIWANCWRLVGGIIASLIVLPFMPASSRRFASLRDRRNWPLLLGGATLGSYIALLCWLAGMKYTQASIAAALNQTSTLWIFLFAVWLLKEPITWKRLVGLVIGVAGVALVTFG